jgi:hypothetical protein
MNVINTWYDKSETTIESVDVEVTRKIKVGVTLKINPSEAWLGIESGTIKITHILSQANIESVDSPDHPIAEYVGQIVHDKEVYLDTMGQPGDSEYQSEYDRLETDPWVVYKYSHTGEWAILPLEEFVQHSMMY